jgi:hypothetical protein
MISKDTAESLKNRPEWPAFEKHVAERVRNLDRVSNIIAASPDQMISEAMGRQRALEIIKEIFEPFEVPVPSKTRAQQHATEKHGL